MTDALKLALAQAYVSGWRFRTLDTATHVFAGVDAPILERRFASGKLVVDVRRSNVQRLLYLEGERFVAERHLVRSLLRPGMHAVDVGANLGYYMLLLREAVGAAGRVDCFEPEPDNLAELERNVAANGFRNVRVSAVALGDSHAEVGLQRGVNGTVLADGGAELQVPLRRLDELIDVPIDFLKIDVEGYEAHVLRGAADTLRSSRPTLFVEVHPWLLPAGESVPALLDEIERFAGKVQLFELRPQARLLEKVRVRYLGGGVRAIPNRAQLLAECAGSTRREPFWAVAARAL